MRKSTVIIDYSEESDADFVNIADKIIADMTTNAGTFPNPDVPIATVQTQRNDFDTAIDVAHDEATTADKDEKRTILAKSVKKNGRYVEKVADGDSVIMLKSGYRISDEPGPVGELPAPESLEVKAEKPAELEVEASSVPKAKGYLFAYTPVGNDDPNPYNWKLRWSSKKKASLKSLNSGERYKVAAAAVGAADEVNFSEPVTRIVQ